MAYVLAIEPDHEQATLLRDAFRTRSHARVRTVDSIPAATEAIAEQIPQLVLISSLLPQREESTLVARLRHLPRETTPEMLLVPWLEKPAASEKATLFQRLRKPRLLLQLFRRKPVYRPRGCDPLVFADQMLDYLATVGPRSREILNRDRRVAIRRSRLKWASAAVDGVEVELIDLSTTGAQILAPTKLVPHHAVRVHLSSDDGQVISEARVVWGGIETEGPDGAEWYRTGITFKAAYHAAIERFCTYEERMVSESTFWGIAPGTALARVTSKS